MARRRHGKHREPPELDITAFLNLMVVLVPFLLISAVFSRLTILELNLPTAAGPSKADKAKVNIEVVIRKKKLQVGDGRKVLVSFPKEKEAEKYPVKKLSAYLLKIKGSHKEKTDAMVLMEADIEYEHLVDVMDAVRGTEVRKEGEEEVQKVVLFPDISIGDAP